IKGNTSKSTLFIFDAPTTGLHFHDIKKLLLSSDALIAQGNSILVIEHNMDKIKSADWMIETRSEGGENGGGVSFEGTPEQMVSSSDTHTARFLKMYMGIPGPNQ